MKKRFSKVLALILTLTTMVLYIRFVGGMTASAEEISKLPVGTVIEFGSYPQKQEIDLNTLAELKSKVGKVADGSWQSFAYYSGTGVWNDGNMKSSKHMKYYDINLSENDKYRAVKFDSYRPYSTGYERTAENSLQDDNGYSTDTIYFFKFQSLEWQLLDPSTGLFICKNIIDSQPYNNILYYYGGQYYGNKAHTYYASDYKNSSVRSWLNSTFFNTAFNSDEKSDIVANECINSSSYNSKFNSAKTTDNVFLLSKSDMTNTAYGFAATEDDEFFTRTARGTDFAKCQGLYVYRNYYSENDGNSSWILRTPYSGNNCELVGEDGSINNTCITSMTDCGIRPAIKLKSTKIINQKYLSLPFAVPSKSGSVQTVNENILWSDDTFEKSSREFHHNMALSALSLVNAAENSKTDAENVMKLLDFSDIRSYNYTADCWDGSKNPAVTFGYKKINNGSGDKYVFAVTIRGLNGIDGSKMNSNPYEEAYANTFKSETSSVLTKLNSYISSIKSGKKITTSYYNTVFFISGHGLSGAVASRLAADLESSSAASGEKIYAYTFGSPFYSGLTSSSVKTNIHNLYLAEDAMSAVNGMFRGSEMFECGTRYGTNYKIKTPTANGINSVYGSVEKFEELSEKNQLTSTYLASLIESDPTQSSSSVENEYHLSEIDVNGKMSFKVCDSLGNTVCTPPDTNGIKIENGIFIHKTSSKYYVFSLTDKEYTIRFDCTGSGQTGFRQAVFSTDLEDVSSYKNFTNIKLSSGKIIKTSVINKGTLPSDTKLYVMTSDGKTPKAEIKTDGTEVEYSPLKGITIEDKSLNYKGSGKLNYKINAENKNYTLSFKSSNPDTVSVDNSGNVKGLSVGSAKITCTVTDNYGNTQSASCTVSVSFAWWQWIIEIFFLGFLWY